MYPELFRIPYLDYPIITPNVLMALAFLAGFWITRREHDPILALGNRELLRLLLAFVRVVLLQRLPQVVGIDPDHRVLTRIELVAALEDLGGDLDLFGRMITLRRRDEELEQRRVESGSTEDTARLNALGVRSDRLGVSVSRQNAHDLKGLIGQR